MRPLECVSTAIWPKLARDLLPRSHLRRTMVNCEASKSPARRRGFSRSWQRPKDRLYWMKSSNKLSNRHLRVERQPNILFRLALVKRRTGAWDSLTPLRRCRPPHLKLTTRSPRLMTDVRRPSSIIATTMARELLGVRLRHQRPHQLLSIRSGPSKASSNTLGSGMM
jgi:hypothetical protein